MGDCLLYVKYECNPVLIKSNLHKDFIGHTVVGSE